MPQPQSPSRHPVGDCIRSLAASAPMGTQASPVEKLYVCNCAMLVPISPAQEDAPRLQEEVLTVKRVYMVPGSLQRVCQLTGEHDRTARVPVASLTESAAHLLGTDLGSSVDLGDRLIFLFGDSSPR